MHGLSESFAVPALEVQAHIQRYTDHEAREGGCLSVSILQDFKAAMQNKNDLPIVDAESFQVFKGRGEAQK